VATLLGAKNGPRCSSTHLWRGGSQMRKKSRRRRGLRCLRLGELHETEAGEAVRYTKAGKRLVRRVRCHHGGHCASSPLNFVLDGEAVAHCSEGLPDFHGLLGRNGQRTASFDLLHLFRLIIERYGVL
jgi:hypothetical protein